MGLALTELHKLPGYREAPRIWRSGVRVLDPRWVEKAIRQFDRIEPDKAFAEWFKQANVAADVLVRGLKAGDDLGIPLSRRIIHKTAERHGLLVSDLTGKSRQRANAAARQHAAYEIRRQCPHLSLPQIGRMFGGRDHSTIHHSLKAWPAKAAKLGFHCEPLGKPK